MSEACGPTAEIESKLKLGHNGSNLKKRILRVEHLTEKKDLEKTKLLNFF